MTSSSSSSGPLSSASPWLVHFRRFSSSAGGPKPRARLVCFPYAGGGAPAFRELAMALPEHVDVIGVQLPGRGHRIREPVQTVAAPLVRGAVEPLLRLEHDVPIVLYGHSMGALLAFEIARELRRRGRSVRHLVVAVRSAPHLPIPTPHAHVLSDDKLVELIRSYGTTPLDLLDNRELLSALLPALRADLQLSERFVCTQEPPLSCPITAVRANGDHSVDPAGIEAWSVHTRAAFRVEIVDGGHLFLRSSLPALVALLTPILASAIEAREQSDPRREPSR